MSSASIAIIGGSIAGCALGIVFSRLRFDVKIYERSEHALNERGAGICIPEELQVELIKKDFFDPSSSSLLIQQRQFITKISDSSPKLLWEHSVKAIAYNWAEIFSQLRKRVNNHIYLAGIKVERIVPNKNKINLFLSNNQTTSIDWVFGCDGINSLVREQLFPNRLKEETNYVAWRGMLPQIEVKNHNFDNIFGYICYDQGHAVTYYVPDRKGGLYLNWLIYQKMTAEEKKQLLTDNKGFFHETSFTNEFFNVEHYDKLQRLSLKFPKIFTDIIRNTQAPFIQNIVDIKIPNLRKGHICLLGDAACISRPHTASGATKALSSALLLQEQLNSHDNIEAAISVWEKQQLESEIKLYELGQIFGKALVTEVPSWQTMTPKKMEEWWNAVMSGRSWYATDD